MLSAVPVGGDGSEGGDGASARLLRPPRLVCLEGGNGAVSFHLSLGFLAVTALPGVYTGELFVTRWLCAVTTLRRVGPDSS